MSYAIAICITISLYLVVGGVFLLGMLKGASEGINKHATTWEIKEIAYLWPYHAWKVWRKWT